eukprot:scaffold303875_cov28-Prasinocladus_malaysianus.AAC.1
MKQPPRTDSTNNKKDRENQLCRTMCFELVCQRFKHGIHDNKFNKVDAARQTTRNQHKHDRADKDIHTPNIRLIDG